MKVLCKKTLPKFNPLQYGKLQKIIAVAILILPLLFFTLTAAAQNKQE